MARARIQLRNAESFFGMGKQKPWRKNEIRVSANSAEIAYYKAHSEFVVTDLVDRPAEQPQSAAPPTPVDTGPPKQTRATLSRLSKPELVQYAAGNYGLALDDEILKEDLISAILEAQG